LQGNRVGLIAFAGDAFMLCPLTLDYSIANLIAESIDEKSVPVAGTDFGRVIDIANGGFEREGSASPVLIIISDGEDNEDRGLIAATEAAKKNLRIYTIGVGTERGAPVPDGRGGYKELPDGSKVLSRLNTEGLTKIAAVGNGLARTSEGGVAAAVDAIVKDIRSLDESRVEERKVIIYRDRFNWFVIPAALLLLWLLLTKPEQPARRSENGNEDRGQSSGVSRNPVAQVSSTFLIVLLCTAMHPEGARAESSRTEGAEGVRRFRSDDLKGAAESFERAATINPTEPTIQYNLGTTKLLLKDHKAAELHLREATFAKESMTRRDAFYNLGVNKLNQAEAPIAEGDVSAAIDQLKEGLKDFRQALVQDPNDRDAAHNFEYALRLMRELEEVQKEESEDDQNQKEDGEDSEGEPNDQNSDAGKSDEKGEAKPGENAQGGSADESGEDGENAKDADPNEGQRGGLEATPTPTPEDAPASGQKTSDEEPGKGPSGGGGQGRPQDRPPTDEELDALRVLNSLEKDKPEQFKKLFRFGGSGKSERRERDW